MNGSDGGSSWFKTGCLGCLGVVGLIVLAVAVLFGLASIQVRNEQVETPSSTHERTAARDAATADAEPARAEPRGTVRAVMSVGEFEIVPAGPGEPLSVDARYNANDYRLSETLEEGEDGWRYDVELERTGSGLLALVKSMLGGTTPKLTLRLPADTRLDLDVEIARSGGTIELGGLWLRNARFDVRQGGFEFAVSEPLKAPMDELAFDVSMGGASLGRLGNASPRALDVRCSMGGLDLDLRGEWVNDSEVSLEASRGGLNVSVPRGITIEGLEGFGDGPGLRDDEVPAPTLRFSTSIADSAEVEVNGRKIGSN